MNIENAIKSATKILSKNNIGFPKLDSEILMSETIKQDRKFVILNLDKKLGRKALFSFKNLIKKRLKGNPIAYLTGKKEFWNSEFHIEKNVLIPRPDTEILVEEALKLSEYKNKCKVLDIGVGSGCVLLSILKEKRNFYGVGIDISKKCLDISTINSFKLGLKNRVKFYKSDIDNFSYGKYDLIISNPPYINRFDLKYLEKDIAHFEPKIALSGGLDGLSEIRKVVSKSSELIKKNGKLILEIGYDQKERVKEILKNKGFYINKIKKDLGNKDRCIISTKI